MRLPYWVFPVHPHHSHGSLAVRYCLWASTSVLNLCLTMSPQATLLLSRRRTQYWRRIPRRQSLFPPFPAYAPLVARFWEETKLEVILGSNGPTRNSEISIGGECCFASLSGTVVYKPRGTAGETKNIGKDLRGSSSMWPLVIRTGAPIVLAVLEFQISPLCSETAFLVWLFCRSAGLRLFVIFSR